MTTETPERKKRPTTEVERRKTKLIGLVSALVVATTPGVYSAWQAAKASYIQRVDRVARDTQEINLQKVVQALEKSIVALEKSCVTHQELIDLVVKLRLADSTSGASRNRTPASAFNDDQLAGKIRTLEAKVDVAEKARRAADVAKEVAPKLRPPEEIRQMVEQRQEAADQAL